MSITSCKDRTEEARREHAQLDTSVDKTALPLKQRRVNTRKLLLFTFLLASISQLGAGCVYRPRGDNSWNLRGHRVWVGTPGSIPDEYDEDVELCIGSSIRLFFSGPYYWLDSLEKTHFVRMLYIFLPGAPSATFAVDDSSEVKKELFMEDARKYRKQRGLQ